MCSLHLFLVQLCGSWDKYGIAKCQIVRMWVQSVSSVQEHNFKAMSQNMSHSLLNVWERVIFSSTHWPRCVQNRPWGSQEACPPAVHLVHSTAGPVGWLVIARKRCSGRKGLEPYCPIAIHPVNQGPANCGPAALTAQSGWVDCRVTRSLHNTNICPYEDPT